MSLDIYNTLTRRKEEFKPLKPGKINFFVCGPTVYDYSHIGHAKTYVQFDMVVKYLRFKGFKVTYLQNITDIDDKIIRKAAESGGKSWDEISRGYEGHYKKDMVSLGVDAVNKYARATDYIKEIIHQVRRLIEKGYAYRIADGWYFDLSKDKDYGKLARRTFSEADDAVSRIDESKEKRNTGDFCLWKFSKPGEPVWKTDIGDGRPGWHIEDTAITEKEFGQQYDIHGGATDLIFPHHEAEIAQMESISGKKPMVKYWMHTGFLNINREKMGKSKGNFTTIKELLKSYKKDTIRYFFASTNYRKPINYSNGGLENAKNSVERLKNIISEIKNDGKINKKYLKEFEKKVDEEINLPDGLAVLWKLVRDRKAEGKIKTIKKIDEVFCFGLLEKEKIEIPEKIKKLAEEREKARKNKQWGKADEIREKINKLGFILEDTEKGAVVKKK